MTGSDEGNYQAPEVVLTIVLGVREMVIVVMIGWGESGERATCYIISGMRLSGRSWF